MMWKKKRTIKEEFFYQNNQIKTMTNNWFFVAMTMLLIQLLWESVTVFRLIISLLFLARLLCSRQVFLLKTCLLVASLTCLFLWLKPAVTLEKSEIRQQQKVLVDPNELKVAGDSLSFVGEELASQQKKKYYYHLPSKEAAAFFEKCPTFLQLEIEGIQTLPQTQRNLGGLDYQDYLKGQSIYQTVQIEKIISVEKSSEVTPVTKIKELRRKISLAVLKNYDTYPVLYINSLMLGVKGAQFQSEKEVFESLGILYLFSLSGMHVVFFIELFRYIFKRLGLTIESITYLEYAFLCFLFIFLGESISVFRAVTIVCLSHLARQRAWSLSSLDNWSLSLIAGILLFPQSVLSLAGQLSYFMALSLIYVSEGLRRTDTSKSNIMPMLLIGLCALPLTSFYFFEWSLWVLFLGVLLLPVIQKYVMPLLLILLLGVSFFPKTILINSINSLFANSHQGLALLAQFSLFKIILGHFSGLILGLSYLLIGRLLMRPIEIKKYVLCLVSVLMLLSLQKYTKQGIVAFVDVGQADSIVIQEPFGGKVVVIDVGGKLNFEKEEWAKKDKIVANATYTLLPFLKSRGIKQIDVLIASHADEDHVGDLLAVHDKIAIKEVIVGEGVQENPYFYQTLQQLEKTGTKISYLLAPQIIKVGQLAFELLYPFEAGRGENEDSLVVTTVIKQKRFLFTGDLDKAGEEKLLTRYPQLSVDILKVGHHGSRTSTGELFLSNIQPEMAIISCGVNNHFNHPHEEVIHNLEEQATSIYQTADSGMVYFEWSIFSKQLLPKTVVK